MMKAIVDENMESGAAAARQFPSSFTIAPEASNAPSITFEFAHQNVLDVLQKIAEISYQLGTPLFFDVAWQSRSSLEFRTYTHQLGVDSSWKILFSDTIGNIRRPRRIEKYSEDYNVINVWGAGAPGNQLKNQHISN